MDQGGRRSWKLTILLSVLGIFLVTPVMGASVTLTPRATAPYGITIANKFGYLNVTSVQVLANLQDFTNGTILFDLRGFSQSQLTIYSYLARSYGNGTFDLRFITGGQKPTVTAKFAASTSFLTSSNTQVVDYSANVSNDPVILSFLGRASQQLFNAAVLASFFFSIIIGTIGLLYVVVLFGLGQQGLTSASGGLDGTRTRAPITSVKLTIAGIAAVIGFGIMVIIVVYFGNVLQGLGF